jgi:DNA-binding NtrC family response regulator
MVQEGLFREDLFYRLNVFTLRLPPLRERKEDIPVLVDHFLKQLPKPIEISSVALQMLMAYSWPGNIRELKNVVESSAVIAENNYIEPAQLPAKVTAGFGAADSSAERRLPANLTLDERLREVERGIIVEALTKTGGVQARASELLGINQRSLWHRIKKLNIDAKSTKNVEN